MATSQGALEKSIFFQKLVLKDSRDPKQKERAKKAIEKLQAELDSLMERKTNPATKKFSPAQIAAQKLFAERARAGTLGKGKRKAAVKRKPNPVTETLIYGLAPGETRDYMEELMYAGGQKLTQAQIDKVFKAASDAGYHSFRVAGFDPTMKPDFAAAVRRKRNPEAIPYGMADVEKFHLGGKMYAEIVKKANNSYDYVVYQMYSTGVLGEKPREQFFDSKNYKTKTGAMRGLEKYVQRLGYKINPDKSKPRAYVMRASQTTGRPPVKGTKAGNRLITRRKKALSAPAGYFPNPKAAMMTGYQVICMHPKKHVVGIFKTMAEAKLVARAMADAKGVAYGVKTVKVHKTHFAV